MLNPTGDYDICTEQQNPPTAVRVVTSCFLVVNAAKLLLNSHSVFKTCTAQAGQPCGLPGLWVALVYHPGFVTDGLVELGVKFRTKKVEGHQCMRA